MYIPAAPQNSPKRKNVFSGTLHLSFIAALLSLKHRINPIRFSSRYIISIAFVIILSYLFSLPRPPPFAVLDFLSGFVALFMRA